jgi:glycosyltransferase involved in cell wall biosynthesis
MCKVSIIVPMHKTEKYIEQCIQSCLGQTMSDVEIILVNDGSPDKSLQIAERYAAIDKRVKVINQPNNGVSVARNAGVESAAGEWIMFLDGDDWLEKDAAETMFNLGNRNNNCEIVICSFFAEFSNRSFRDRFFHEKSRLFTADDSISLVKSSMVTTRLSQKGAHANVGVPWAKMYSRDFLAKNKCRFPVGLKRMQDMVFNLYAFRNSTKVVYEDIPVYHYRMTNNSATKQYSHDFEDTSKRILFEIDTFLRKNHLYNELSLVYYAKAAKLYIELIKLQYAPSENKLSYSAKQKELRVLYHSVPFRDCFIREINEYLSTSQKLICSFLRYRMIGFVHMLCAVKYRLSKRALYVV